MALDYLGFGPRLVNVAADTFFTLTLHR